MGARGSLGGGRRKGGRGSPAPSPGCGLPAPAAQLLDSARAPVPEAAPIPELPGPRGGRPGPGRSALGTRAAVPVAAAAPGRRRQGRGAACALPARGPVRCPRPLSLRAARARAALRPFTSHLLPFPLPPRRPPHVFPAARACAVELRPQLRPAPWRTQATQTGGAGVRQDRIRLLTASGELPTCTGCPSALLYNSEELKKLPRYTTNADASNTLCS